MRDIFIWEVSSSFGFLKNQAIMNNQKVKVEKSITNILLSRFETDDVDKKLSLVIRNLNTPVLTEHILLGYYRKLTRIGTINQSASIFIDCDISGLTMISFDDFPFNKKGEIQGRWLMAIKGIPNYYSLVHFSPTQVIRMIPNIIDKEIQKRINIIANWLQNNEPSWNHIVIPEELMLTVDFIVKEHTKC